MRTVAAYAGALRGQGLSLRAIAAQLEAHGFTTRRGGPRQAVQVKRVLDRTQLNKTTAPHDDKNDNSRGLSGGNALKKF